MLSKDIKKVQTTRAWAGLFVVFFGDVGIALAAILVAIHLGTGAESVAILTSAFTAITAITTAFFGIRAATNAAQSAVAAVSGEGKTTNSGEKSPEGDAAKKVT
ncbi:hypothetical protein HRW16_30280 [Streptomyces lunaelactis]|uniref:hypothetical protein n=1 Tax=Streptomyces lunaelactis TaxID=1535768 RepID=UPI0015859972|nr:hypothetical protein [Streptomyces lunaelactis]NUK38367.1 hypothetical protein [Streptomyces lunaelactis]NUK45404.1 hypothetical protein [Streptomyces lunaelactis]NUK61472.1 hypothetical protein [Streptomyces lunaelactis]NUK96041.1 hypothetical protein [Streptomyces lunaelactis]NUL33906.1 hypothetical protein [Streptomyces lunaelactis]